MTRISVRIPVAVVSATLLLGALAPLRASGTTIDDKKAQAQQIQAQINENGDRIAALTEQYNGAVLEYQNAQAKVAEAKQHLAAAEAAQSRLSDLVAARGAALYTGAQDPTTLLPDTNIKSFNELGARAKYGEITTGNDEQLIANLERATARPRSATQAVQQPSRRGREEARRHRRNARQRRAGEPTAARAVVASQR